MLTIQKDRLLYFAAENISAPHGFTTRKGGVSQGHLSALNLGIHRGDEWQNVLENYRILGQAMEFDPHRLVLTTQTHSDTVRVVDKALWGAGLYRPELPPCDALITNTPGTALAVFTADCTPVLLYDPVTGAVGAAHAGWRGTAADIGGKTVRAMEEAFGCRPENICAAIGPNIGPCCFETGPDVPEAMEQLLGRACDPWIRKTAHKYYVNLKEINAALLRRAGVRSVDISPLCTACNTELFWSYRKTGDRRGSQGAIILCKEKEI